MYHLEEPLPLVPGYVPQNPNNQLSILLSQNEYVPMQANSDAFFAKERFKLHQAAPDEGVTIDILKTYIQKKYGI